MRLLFLFLATLLCLGSPVWAAGEVPLRQKLFEADKSAALAGFDAAQKQACVKAFNARYQSQYTLSGALAFDEHMSLIAYDRLFWKGESSVQRGVIFDAAVNDKSGAMAGHVMCYYAITDYRLDFQSAYMLPLHMKDPAAPQASLKKE